MQVPPAPAPKKSPAARVLQPPASSAAATSGPVGSVVTSGPELESDAVVVAGEARPPRGRRRPLLSLGAGVADVEFSTFSCEPLQRVDPQAVAVTYWFDARPDGPAYTVHLLIEGRLRGEAPDGRASTFRVVRSIDGVLPGSGRNCFTMRVSDLAYGTWDVTVSPVVRAPKGAPTTWVHAQDPRLPRGSSSGLTTFGPVARTQAPGVKLGAWPTLVGSGVVLALLLQSQLASGLGLPTFSVFLLTVVACLLGLVGARAYYLITHLSQRHDPMTQGLSVQGFVLLTTLTWLAGSALLDLSVGAVLDATAPGLLLGMTVGRLGCVLGGCCVGRPTAAPWGVWSSDRRRGTRRVPVQMLESGMAGALVLLTSLAVLVLDRSGEGLVFVAGVAAYTAGRQILFPMRQLQRATRYGRPVVLAASFLVSVGATVALLQP